MKLLCLLGMHRWAGCRCKTCSATRDTEHDWNGCKCSRCAKTRNSQHDWVHKHSYTYQCRRCGATRNCSPVPKQRCPTCSGEGRVLDILNGKYTVDEIQQGGSEFYKTCPDCAGSLPPLSPEVADLALDPATRIAAIKLYRDLNPRTALAEAKVKVEAFCRDSS